MQQAGVPFHFRGGTALHTKLPNRRRFSIDVDVVTNDRTAVEKALRNFTQRFPKSGVKLQEPPGELFDDDVRHMLTFQETGSDGTKPLTIYVEVVETKLDGLDAEPLRIRGDGFDWKVDVTAPSFSAFAGQKLAVLGPNTIGKRVGLNEDHSRKNASVCKQIFDLRELLMNDLDAERVSAAYDVAVVEANRLRKSTFTAKQCLADAADLMQRLRQPQSKEKTDEVRYGLWAGQENSWRYIAQEARAKWTPTNYRIVAGTITRLAQAMREPKNDFDRVPRPLNSDAPPAEILVKIGAAQAANADWFSQADFGADAMLAWAWAPRDLW